MFNLGHSIIPHHHHDEQSDVRHHHDHHHDGEKEDTKDQNGVLPELFSHFIHDSYVPTAETHELQAKSDSNVKKDVVKFLISFCCFNLLEDILASHPPPDANEIDSSLYFSSSLSLRAPPVC
jgi:hypothetical protein